MTPLRKRIRRVTLQRHRGRRLVVAIVPADDEIALERLEVRDLGRRSGFVEPLAAVYDWMAKRRAAELVRQRQEARKARRKGKG